MATCPRCRGHLTEGHRCPRRRGLVTLEIIGSAVAGALIGWIILAAFDPRGQAADLDTISMLSGALVGVAINRFLRA
jgi:hypothetical protein